MSHYFCAPTDMPISEVFNLANINAPAIIRSTRFELRWDSAWGFLKVVDHSFDDCLEIANVVQIFRVKRIRVPDAGKDTAVLYTDAGPRIADAYPPALPHQRFSWADEDLIVGLGFTPQSIR